MRESYRRERSRWQALLARPEVTLMCYCTPGPDGVLRCHRRLLAEAILPRLGAEDCGERSPDRRR